MTHKISISNREYDDLKNQHGETWTAKIRNLLDSAKSKFHCPLSSPRTTTVSLDELIVIQKALWERMKKNGPISKSDTDALSTLHMVGLRAGSLCCVCEHNGTESCIHDEAECIQQFHENCGVKIE